MRNLLTYVEKPFGAGKRQCVAVRGPAVFSFGLQLLPTKNVYYLV